VSHEAWPERTAARALLIQLKNEAKCRGDHDRARTLAQSQACFELATRLYRRGGA
jgi:hypothetical protein